MAIDPGGQRPRTGCACGNNEGMGAWRSGVVVKGSRVRSWAGCRCLRGCRDSLGALHLAIYNIFQSLRVYITTDHTELYLYIDVLIYTTEFLEVSGYNKCVHGTRSHDLIWQPTSDTKWCLWGLIEICMIAYLVQWQFVTYMMAAHTTQSWWSSALCSF